MKDNTKDLADLRDQLNTLKTDLAGASTAKNAGELAKRLKDTSKYASPDQFSRPVTY